MVALGSEGPLDRYLISERLCVRCLPCRCRNAEGHTFSGQIHQRTIHSKLLNAQMELFVYLPPGFSPSDPWRYPTLYLQDGQNVFDEKSAVFGVEWGVDEAAEKLILQGRIKGIIVVAVANTPNRIALYTPFPDAHHGGGYGDLYRDFFIDELKPWVDREYPTSNRATDTAVAGSSLGGLCSLYISWSRPAVFGKVAALSPSLWWAEGQFIKYIGAQEVADSRPVRIWIDTGYDESLADENQDGVPDTIDDLRALRDALLSKGFVLESSLFYREVPNASHNEAAWAARIEDVLCALFPTDERVRG